LPSDSTLDLSCSYAGGCTYTINHNGLAANFYNNPENNYLHIFGYKTHFRSLHANPSKAIIRLPEVSTDYSLREYELSEPKRLWGMNRFGSDYENLDKLFDFEKFEDYSSASQCYAGIEMPHGHVGVLEKVKLFVRNITDKTP